MPLNEVNESWATNLTMEMAPIIREDLFLFSSAHLSPAAGVQSQDGAMPPDMTLSPLCSSASTLSAEMSAFLQTSLSRPYQHSDQLVGPMSGTAVRLDSAALEKSQPLLGGYQHAANSDCSSVPGEFSPCSSLFISSLNSTSSSGSPPEIGNLPLGQIEHHQPPTVMEGIDDCELLGTHLCDSGILSQLGDSLSYASHAAAANNSRHCQSSIVIKQESYVDSGSSPPASDHDYTMNGLGADPFYPAEAGVREADLESRHCMSDGGDFPEEQSDFIHIPSPPLHHNHHHDHRQHLPPHAPAKVRSKMHDLALAHRLITNQTLQNTRGQGEIELSPEEKRTLLSEGYSLPTRLPLSRDEEEALKVVRRKIKNKLSAQESRRKRKEYMDSLERKAHGYYNDNLTLRQRIRQLELANHDLCLELKKMRENGYRRLDASHNHH